MTESNVAEKQSIKQQKRILVNPGDRFGRLVVVGEVEPQIDANGRKYRKVLCQCDCGNMVKVQWSSLKNKGTRSCGCIRGVGRKMRVNTGMRFGRLTVIEEVKPYIDPSGQKYRKIRLRCDCGNITEAILKNLRRGDTKSCGCLSVDRTTKHGLYNHPLYKIWADMKQRCTNPNSNNYDNYGGRGIYVTSEWSNDFEVFYKWAIANGWRKRLVVDREDNDGGYTPDNVRFVDYGLSGRNKRLLSSRNTSGFRGVSFIQPSGKWNTRITSKGKCYRLGHFFTAIEGAMAYDKAAKFLNAGHPLNFPGGDTT